MTSEYWFPCRGCGTEVTIREDSSGKHAFDRSGFVHRCEEYEVLKRTRYEQQRDEDALLVEAVRRVVDRVNRTLHRTVIVISIARKEKTGEAS